MNFLLGLTGSIGMGKSTTAKMFAEAGCAVWDADAVVHRLYAPGGPAVEIVRGLYPDAVTDGSVDRAILRAAIAETPELLDRIQAQVHPLVAADRAAFLAGQGADVVLLDIPLLYETGADEFCDAVVVVSVAAATQRERVLARGEMTEAEFEMILARQVPDAEKRARADFVITTDTLDNARQQVADVLADIRGRLDA